MVLVGSVLLSLGVTVTVGIWWGRSMMGRWARFRSARWLQTEIRSMQLRPLSSLKPGPNRVHVTGTVEALETKNSPRGTPCVAYLRGHETVCQPFLLRADSCAVWVQAELFSLQGHLEQDALLRHGDVVVLEGRVAAVPRSESTAFLPTDVTLMLTDDLGQSLRVMLPNAQVEQRAAYLTLWGRTLAGAVLLPLLLIILQLGSCMGFGYVVLP